MSQTTPTHVIGTDNIRPVYDENSTFRIWGVDDIYVGLEGANRFVPKIKDYVIRPETYEMWIVTAVNPDTLIPTLKPIKPFGTNTTMSQEDILFGVGPGTQAQLLRVYINRSSYPYRVTVDTHCFIGGAQNAYAVIYKGGDPTVGGEPISRLYDTSGNFIGVEVPLEAVALDSHTNHSIKIVQECFTTTDIKDGEPLYVVFYNQANVPTSKAMLLAENTTHIRGLDIQRKFVTGISLESPWLSASDSNVLSFPLNIPLDALDLVGVVHYNVGEPLRLPVDGTKFSLAGLDGYISSIPSEKFDLALVYNFSADEVGYAGQGMTVDRKATAPYSVITKVIEPGYTVKMFVYPFWDPALQGYRLRFWMYNLARTTFVEVTDLVSYSSDQPVFDPRGYGYKQRIQVNLNLRKISTSYKPMIHTQMFEITLFSEPQDNNTPWVVMSQLSPNMPGFGRDLYAKRTAAQRINLKSGRATKEEWIRDFFYNADPLVDRRSEVNAPEPTHFWVSANNGQTWTQYFLNDSWNKDLAVSTPMTLYSNILVRFTRPLLTGQMELAMTSVVLRA